MHPGRAEDLFYIEVGLLRSDLFLLRLDAASGPIVEVGWTTRSTLVLPRTAVISEGGRIQHPQNSRRKKGFPQDFRHLRK